MIENGSAPRGDCETKLVEREGKGHAHGFVEFLVLTLVHNRDHEIIRIHLELLEGVKRLCSMGLANEIQHPLQQPQPPRARVAAQITRNAGDTRSEYRKDKHAIE